MLNCLSIYIEFQCQRLAPIYSRGQYGSYANYCRELGFNQCSGLPIFEIILYSGAIDLLHHEYQYPTASVAELSNSMSQIIISLFLSQTSIYIDI